MLSATFAKRLFPLNANLLRHQRTKFIIQKNQSLKQLFQNSIFLVSISKSAISNLKFNNKLGVSIILVLSLLSAVIFK